MRETKRAAVARYAARGKQYIVMLRAAEGAQGEPASSCRRSFMRTRCARSPRCRIGDATVREGELNLAKQLVDQIAVETFDPAAYEDEVRKRIQADIERKVEGKEIAAPSPTEEPARVIDLMEALKASLAAVAAEGAPSNDAGASDDRKGARRSAASHEGHAKAEPKRTRAAKR